MINLMHVCFFFKLLTVYIPGRNVMKGDCGLGHLTSKGYKQEEDNGKNLRKAYVDTGFLSPNYSNHEIFFRTDGECFSRSFIFDRNKLWESQNL